MMQFQEYPTKAIDIKQAWMATNVSCVEVDIALNTNNQYELWIAAEFHGFGATFDICKRMAESKVPVAEEME